ncbi:hypothetical protein [Bradyrhizobium liaoningense]
MALSAVSGQKIFIGGVKDDQAADFTASDFSGETWVEIDGWTQCGAAGDTAQLITSSLINRGRDVKKKGTKNAGSMQNVFAIVPGNAGQTALIAAANTSNNYAFKIENNDAATSPASPVPQPSKRYFVGLVMTAEEAGGSANTIQNLNATIEINSNIVKVAANP